jgi:hypothetical protein
MLQLTEAQQKTFEMMQRYHIVAQMHTGAVIVVSGQQYQNAQVIDIDGRVYSFSRYLAILDRR